VQLRRVALRGGHPRQERRTFCDLEDILGGLELVCTLTGLCERKEREGLHGTVPLSLLSD